MPFTPWPSHLPEFNLICFSRNCNSCYWSHLKSCLYDRCLVSSVTEYWTAFFKKIPQFIFSSQLNSNLILCCCRVAFCECINISLVFWSLDAPYFKGANRDSPLATKHLFSLCIGWMLQMAVLSPNKVEAKMGFQFCLDISSTNKLSKSYLSILVLKWNWIC